MRIGIATMFLALVLASAVDSDDGGTRSPFDFGAGARALALGGSNLAQSSSWTAPYWNPSRLSAAERVSLGGFHSRLYDSDVKYNYLGLVYPTLDRGTFGVGLFRLGINGIEKRDAGNLLRGTIEDSRLAVHVAYGKQLSNYSVGVAVSIEHHSIDTYKSTSSPGVSLSVGRKWQINSNRLRHLSAVVVGRNLLRPTTKLVDSDVAYPYTVDLGLSLQLIPNPSWDHSLSLSTRLTKTDFIDLKLAVGLEYDIGSLLQIRGGVQESKYAVGMGLKYKSFSFDYALVERDLGSLHMFSLTSLFGKPKSQKLNMRIERREAEFNQMMEERLAQSNRELITELVAGGQVMLESGDLVTASTMFDRALFLARSNQEDTTESFELARSTRSRIDEVLQKQRYGRFIDSAQSRLSQQDYIAATYFANLALSEENNSTEANQILSEANNALEAAASREEMIEMRLWEIDSLLSYGQIDKALINARSLNQFAPDEMETKTALRRAEFENFKATATNLYSAGVLEGALRAVDSAMVVFPDHKWGQSFRARILKDKKRKEQKTAISLKTRSEPMSPELSREVQAAYQQAQQLFKEGKLINAIKYWEKVETLAPGYASTRKYLITAYKYVGIELYGESNLDEAVIVWEKATLLDAANQEILEYLKRTRSEIKKLRELSYEL